MSYILQALKKSEAERAKGIVPRLTAHQAAVPRARAAAWPWFIGAALVANAAVVVLAWGPKIPLLTGGGRDAGAPAVTRPSPVPDGAVVTAVAPTAPANGAEPAHSVTAPPRQVRPTADEADPPAAPSGEVRPPAAAAGETRPPAAAVGEARPPDAVPGVAGTPGAPPPSASAGPAVRPPPAPAPSTGTQTETRRAAAGDVGSGDLRQEPPSEASPPASTRVAAVSPTPPASAEPGAAAAPAPPAEPAEEPARRAVPGAPVPLRPGTRTPAAAGPELALAVPEPAPPEPAPEAPVEADPYASVPMLWQLPSVIRSQLPKLNMTVHVYAPEAPGRFVIVDRKKYREGDVLTGGVKLEAILVDGIVLNHLGRRYRIAN